MKLSFNHLSASLLIGFFLLTFAINNLFSSMHRNHAATQKERLYHVSDDLQKRFTLGYDRSLSVLYWFGVISNFGGKNALHADYTALANRLDIITTLNPYAEPAYFMAALVLPWQLQSTTLSRPLLKKAMQFMPKKWTWPYYYGFNAYWFDRDMDQAAEYMTRAASLPNVPMVVIHVASKMHAKANNLDAAITFLQQLLEHQQDASLKKVLTQRIATIRTEKILRRIEHDILAVPGWKGDLARLHDAGIHIPFQLPDGGIVIFDKQHRPMSSKQSHRFKIFTPAHFKKKLKQEHG